MLMVLVVAIGALARRGETAESVRIDRYGDALPHHALLRIGTARFRASQGTRSLVFSPDGKSLFWGGDSVGVVDVKTGKALPGPQQLYGGAIALSPDGKLLAIRSYVGQLYLWDTRGKQLRSLGEPGAIPMQLLPQVSCVAFSPDGKFLVDGGNIGSARLWDVANRKEAYSLEGDPDDLLAAAFSPDGKILAASTADKAIVLWDTASGRKLSSLVGHQEAVYALAFASDGRTLASVCLDRTLLWDMRTRKELRRSKRRKGTSDVTTFSLDGKNLISGGGDKTIRQWETATGKEIRCLNAGEDEATALAISPDGRTLAAAVAGHIQLWDMATGNVINPQDSIPDAVLSLAFTPDGNSLTTASCSNIQFWSARTGEKRGRSHELHYSINSIRFVQNSESLLVSGYYFLSLWDVALCREKRQWANEPAIFRPTLSPDGKILAVVKESTTIRLREAATGKELRTFEVAGGVCDQAFSPVGRFLAASGYNKTIHLWDIITGRETVRFQGGNMSSLAFAPNGRILVSTIADLHSVELVEDKDGITRRVDHLQRGEVRVWEIVSGQELRCVKGCSGMAISSDGRLLATAGPANLLRIWDTLRGEELLRLEGSQTAISSLSFSPDGDRLATGGTDTTVLLWDVRPARRALARPRQKVSASEWASVWDDMAADAPKAYRAIARLTDEPEKAVLLLKDRLRPASLDSRRVIRLISDLDSDHFTVREKAARELEKLGELVEPAIIKTLEQQPTPEVRRRLEGLREKLVRSVPSRETLRAFRVVEALERIGTPDARQLLEKLAAGTPDARLTREAQSSLHRLAKRSTDKR